MVSSALISVNQPSSAVKNIKLMEPPVDRIRLSQTGKDQQSKPQLQSHGIICVNQR